MAGRARVRYREEPGAETTIKRLARPQVIDIADELVKAIVENVPVQSGTSRRMFRQGLRRAPLSAPTFGARVQGFPPNWHWFEYGTRWNPAYAPIRRAVERLGMRYVRS